MKKAEQGDENGIKPKFSPTLKIHTAALRHNLGVFKKLAPKSKILLPVKANAYGCGIETLYPFFEKAPIDMLGVANVYEGVELRKLGFKKPILNLGGFFPETLPLFLQNEIIPSITDLPQLHALSQVKNQNFGVHIKLDLGMGRIGIQRHEVDALLTALEKIPHAKVTGIFTHFPHTGNAAKEATPKHNSDFVEYANRIIERLQLSRADVLLHAANSYSTIFFPETHHDMVRPGILFYGYYQSEEDRIEFNPRFGFRPSLELSATPISIRRVPQGFGISYSSLYVTKDAWENVGVLPLGYADGIPRALSNKIVFGMHPLLGRVTMDQIIVGNATEPKAIRLLGEGVPSLELWGKIAESFSYELMTHFGARLRRELQ